MAVAETINEINDIINALKGYAEAGNKLEGDALHKINQRLTHLHDKTQTAGITNVLSDDMNDLAIKATTGATAGKKPIVGLGWKLIGFSN